ncbi:hypothetical protein KVF89_09735 [Nocardioides carbamazepini]|uniref:hypothetical protein n=1 Tax=Nocardioides carbamazepini TaxID=2854259 RepID=UPI00214A0719|nr:hypothetical protein [Nocardioides carbamazepini]MCR1782814.1 hypothetical protein [Nocardioides carbamazepini]
MSAGSPTGRLVAALTLVTGLALAACDGGGDDPDRPDDGTAKPTVAAAAVLHDPERTWELRAADVVPNGRFAPLGPVGDDEVAGPSAVAVGDVLVAAVADEGAKGADEGADDAAPLLVGVSGDGKVLWRGKDFGACWTPDHASLYCTRGNALVRVNPESGGAGAGADVAVAPGSAPVLDDGVLYVVVTPPGADESAYPPPFAVAALDAMTLTSVWPDGPAAVEELAGLGAGSPALDLSGDHVSVAAWKDTPSGQADATQFDLDRATGAVLGSSHLGKGAFLDRPWTVRRGFGNDKIEVSRDGQVLFQQAGQPWDSQDDRLVSPEGRLGVGSTLYDVTTGDPVWERPDLGDELSGWRWTADRAQVAVTGFDTKAGKMTTTYLDAATGATLWSGPGSDVAPTETPDALLQVETDFESSWLVHAIDRASGDVAWTKDVSEVGRAGNKSGLPLGGPYVSSGTVWVLGATTLVGFTDFPG